MTLMPIRRLLLLVCLALVMYGSLGVIGGYACYLRGDGYRNACAAALSERLKLPSDIGAVVPRSRDYREFRDIAVWLPERRGRALSCERAVILQRPDDRDPDAFEIRLFSGACEISTRTWLMPDYRGVFESSLRPGFDPDGPRRVTFQDMSLRFVRDQFQVELGQAAGSVVFQNADLGRASIFCREFNGHPCASPVGIAAAFSSRNGGVQIDRLDLTVPEIPINLVGIVDLAGIPIQSGVFKGRLTYGELEFGRRLTASGRCTGLELRECTAGLTPIPWGGQCPEIELQELRIVNNTPARLHFRGILSDVDLGDILETWGLSGVRGKIHLAVGDADLSLDGVDSFIVAGGGKGVSLESLSRALGWGVMTGDLDIVISDLTIVNNRLQSLDVELIVADATESPNWVEGRLLRELVKRMLNMEMPSFLPERIEYTKLGLKLEVRDEVLYIFGAHGAGETTILTVRMYGRDVPLVFEPRRSIDLAPWLDQLRARVADASDRIMLRRGADENLN